MGEFLYRYSSPFPTGTYEADIESYLKKEIDAEPLLNKEYAATRVYYDTEKYCMIPSEFFKKEEAMNMLGKLHQITDADEVLYVDIPEQKGELVYSIPTSITTNITRCQKNAEFYPISYFLLDKISLLIDNNKILVHFSNNIVHIVAAERDKLLLANSYPASDFDTAQYYVFLVTKEVMFNPEQTVLHVSGDVTAEQEKKLKRYFLGTKRSEL